MNLYNYSEKKKSESKMTFKTWQFILLGVFVFIFLAFAGLCVYLKTMKSKESKYTGFSEATQNYIFDMYGFSFDLFIPDASFLPTEITDLYGVENIKVNGIVTKTGIHSKIDKEGLYRPSVIEINKNGIFISTEYWGYILDNNGGEDSAYGDSWFYENGEVYVRLGDGFTGEKFLSDLKMIIFADGSKQTKTQDKLPALYIKDKSAIPQNLVTDKFFNDIEGEIKVSIKPVEGEIKTCIVMCDAGRHSFSVTISEYKSYIADYDVSNYMNYENVIKMIKETEKSTATYHESP